MKGSRSYKILLLNEVDRLSREAQHSLRRTMEKYSSTCRLIFSCSNVSKVSIPCWKYESCCDWGTASAAQEGCLVNSKRHQ